MTRLHPWVPLLVIMTMATQMRGQAGQRALLPVRINEGARGEVLAFIEGEDVLLPRTYINTLALPLEQAITRTEEGEVLVSLRSLAPHLAFTIDPVDLVLSITVDPQFLGRREFSAQPPGSETLDRGGDPSLFLNYSLNGQKLHTPGLFTEFGAGRGQRFFYQGLSRGGDGRWLRGLTYLQVDSPRQLRRWTAGDAIVGSDVLGGSIDLTGLTLSRQFDLQPYLIRSPSRDLTGAATTPSTVEVYVNGQLTRRIQVEPGVFTLRDLPVTGGIGSTRLVVRDAFGRETSQEDSFYYSTSILRRGFSDYVFSAGAIRDDLSRSFHYSGPGTLAQYRRGITERLTIGARFEAGSDRVSGGPRLIVATPLGDLDAGAGLSEQEGRTGHAASVAYRFTAPRVSWGLSAVSRSDHYATLSLPAAGDRTTRDWNAYLSGNAGLFSLGLIASRSETRSGERLQRLALQGNAPLGRFGNLFASAGTVEQSGRRSPEFRLGLTVALSHGTTADVLVQRSDGRDGVRAEVRRPLTLADGFGYTVQNDTISDQRLVSLQYQNSFGRYQVDADPRDGERTSYSVAGGLVSIGREILASRPVQDSYALARVGVPGVRILASNQDVGRTSRRGDLLIPRLLPHYLNVLRIDDKDVPIDFQVTGTELTVVPPSRGGVVARFPVRRLHSYTGTLRLIIIGQSLVPSLGQLEVQRDGEPMTLPLGRDGEFYLEDLSPGSYPARLLLGKVQCNLSLDLPAAQTSTTDLGVIPCTI